MSVRAIQEEHQLSNPIIDLVMTRHGHTNGADPPLNGSPAPGLPPPAVQQPPQGRGANPYPVPQAAGGDNQPLVITEGNELRVKLRP